MTACPGRQSGRRPGDHEATHVAVRIEVPWTNRPRAPVRVQVVHECEAWGCTERGVPFIEDARNPEAVLRKLLGPRGMLQTPNDANLPSGHAAGVEARWKLQGLIGPEKLAEAAARLALIPSLDFTDLLHQALEDLERQANEQGRTIVPGSLRVADFNSDDPAVRILADSIPLGHRVPLDQRPAGESLFETRLGREGGGLIG